MIRDLLNKISLTPKMLLLTFCAGAIVWGAQDYIITKKLKSISDSQLTDMLSGQLQEDRIHFDNYMGAYHQTLKLISSQKNFRDYVFDEKRFADGAGVVDYSETPTWLPDASAMRKFVRIHYALLMDGKGRVREVYHGWPEPLPQPLRRPSDRLIQLSLGQSFLTYIDGLPFLLTSEPVKDSKGKTAATLMLAASLNDDFLIASQGLTGTKKILGLVEGANKPRVIASTRPDLLPAGAFLDAFRDGYIIIGKSFFDWGGSEVILQLTSLMPKSEFEKMNKSILNTERLQRAIISFLFILSFVLIMYWITRHIQRLTFHITDFSQNTLNMPAADIPKGDQLHILENQFHKFTETIMEAREQLKRQAEKDLQRNYDTQFAISSLLRLSLEDTSLEKLLKQALEIILSIPWLSFESRGAIFLMEDDRKKLIMKAQKGLAEPIQRECETVPLGRCLCGVAALKQEVQFAGALDKRHEVSYEDITPHGHYCVPIVYSSETLGVINMYLREGHQWNEREEEFLKAIANALAGIIRRKNIEKEREGLIAEIRKTFAVISRSHKEWQDTFDGITDMIAIIDRDFNIMKANRAFSAYFGHQPQEVINRKCYELLHDGDSPITNCPHARSLLEGRPVTEEIFDQKTNRIFRISVFPYYSHEGELIGSIHAARDITVEKEKEMRFIMSERLAALGQMAAGIAHEINNPLAAIAGCAEGLLTRLKKGKVEYDLFENYLRIIEEEIMRCKSITTGMLSFVKKTISAKKTINLNLMLDRAVEIIGFQGRLKDVRVVKKYEEGIPFFFGSEGELRQVLLAIITNSLDAMEDEGTLTIETGRIPPFPASLKEISEEETKGGTLFIKISDTGPGIPAENVGRIFDPFFTTKSDIGGTGLGLSIAKKIISGHGGDIDVSSNEGSGATFTITLPA